MRKVLEGRDIRVRDLPEHLVREVAGKGGEESGEKGKDRLRGVVREELGGSWKSGTEDGRGREIWEARREGT